MGAVYRAEDTRLEREVAIKVLPEAFVADAERLARFEREAKMLALLDHPNIAAIYEVGSAVPQRDPSTTAEQSSSTVREDQEVHFLAMQLAPGKDLAETLGNGALEVEAALKIALQIAEGLEAAHESGVVHRDLKPGNIMVDAESTTAFAVKLLDFGLAKPDEGTVSDPSLTRSPTLTARMTSQGTILGTAAYMSPEQARGKSVDKRADIWAFGCILFEMLTGRRPFGGSDVSEVLAAVIRAKPDLDTLPPAVPARIRYLIDRCLRKDPRTRLRDIGDARTVLEEIRDLPADDTVVTGSPRSRLAAGAPWLLVAALAIAGLTQLLTHGDDSVQPPPLRRFAIDLPWHSVPNWSDFTAAISPSGTHIAYNGRVYNRVDVYIRSLDSLHAKPVAPARESASFFFSPDGDWMGLESGTRLSKVPIRGGRPVSLADLSELDTYGFSWGPEGDILIGATGGLYRIPSSGGQPVAVTRADEAAGEIRHLMPWHLPGGRRALLSIINEVGPATIAIVDLADGSVTRLPIDGLAAQYSLSGHLLFRQGSTTMAVPFDPVSLSIEGNPVPVLEDVQAGPWVANDGTMLYIPRRGESSAQVVWVDRTGRPTTVEDEPRNYSHLDLSNDGRTALLNVGADIYAFDLERGTRQLLASEGALFPIFSSDDRYATFRRSSAIVRKPASGGGSLESILEGDSSVLDIAGDLRPARSTVPTSWNPLTGDLALFDNASDIWTLRPDGSVTRFLNSEANERTGRFSPDGNWLAYVSDETGEYQVYVVPYPGPGPKLAISIAGGLSPIWSPNGSELFFRNGGKVMSAAVTRDPEIRFAAPVELFEGPYALDLMGHQRWDVAPDGKRFLMVESDADFRLVIVQSWFEELERLAPTNR